MNEQILAKGIELAENMDDASEGRAMIARLNGLFKTRKYGQLKKLVDSMIEEWAYAWSCGAN